MRFVVLLAVLFNFNRAHSQSDKMYGYIDSATFRKTEIPPMFVGGAGAWKIFLEKNLQQQGAQGTVTVEFTIEKNDNSPKNIEIYRSDDSALDNEAKRLIKKLRWVPAIQYGNAVAYRMRQEIVFKF